MINRLGPILTTKVEKMTNPDFYRIQGTECIDYETYTLAYFKTFLAAEKWLKENKGSDQYLYYSFDIQGCYFND